MEPAPHQHPELRRSSSDRVITGVLGGLADYLHVDSILLRIAAVIVLIVNWPIAVIAYGVAWLLIPDRDGSVLVGPRRAPLDGPAPAAIAGAESGSQVASEARDPGPMRWLLGIGLIGVGAVVLLDTVAPNVDAGDILFASLLILGGVVLVVRELRS